MPEIQALDLDGHSAILIITHRTMIPGFTTVAGTLIIITGIIILITTGHILG
jgi:hypothetical protein